MVSPGCRSGGTTALAVVAGPLLGGALTDGFGWSASFLINLPLRVIAIKGDPGVGRPGARGDRPVRTGVEFTAFVLVEW
jgi:MFS family permease